MSNQELVSQELHELSINTIRFLAVDAVQKANSGHPGLPMGAAVMAYTLWMNHLRHNPNNPTWADRDRFILSAGHGSMLLYALLHLTGYDLSLEEIKNFRQWDSMTPGHPESHLTPGVEVTTGPLGQGFGNGVGMAIAERVLREQFNKPDYNLVDHYIYAIVSDGDLMEGVSAEAASYAGTQKLGKLIYLYDDNEISIEGDTDKTFREDVAQRFQAYGWQVIGPIDGNDMVAVDSAIKDAKSTLDQPSLIICQTAIGYGSPNKAGTHEVHGAPLGEDEVALTKENLGWPKSPKFHIPDEALEHFRHSLDYGETLEAEWNKMFAEYRAEYPNEAAEFERRMVGVLPENWDAGIPVFAPDDGPMSTRVAGGNVLRGIYEKLPELVGGSADLEPSTKTWLDGAGEFGWDEGGQNLRYGVREHAMGALAVGMAHHGGVLPFTATFLVFSDYMRPPMRLAALSHQRIICVFTHDSIGLGEDGPTHQPVEHLMAMRAVPRLRVMRPADANEAAEAWRQGVLYQDGPTLIVLTRQKLPILERDRLASAAGTAQGAYILQEPTSEPDVALLATGSEVHLALEAAEALSKEDIAALVVSMPCWELFDMQPDEYRKQVLPPGLPKLAIEAGSPLGWYKYVGETGNVIGLDRFGASAPGNVVMDKLGFNVENVVRKVKALL